jgi:hypothetical protein
MRKEIKDFLNVLSLCNGLSKALKNSSASFPQLSKILLD